MIIYILHFTCGGSECYTASRKLPSDMCWVTGYCLHLLNIILWKNASSELLFIFMTIKPTHWSGFWPVDFTEIKFDQQKGIKC